MKKIIVFLVAYLIAATAYSQIEFNDETKRYMSTTMDRYFREEPIIQRCGSVMPQDMNRLNSLNYF